MTISKEQPFKVNATSFAISPSAEGYTLNYSANGEDWTAWEKATPANENCIVNGCAYGMYYKLVGNDSEVRIQF